MLNLALILLVGTGVAAAAGAGGSLVGPVPIVWLCAVLAFAMQWVAFVPAFRWQTERFYDLVGGLTYGVVVVSAVVLSGHYGPRSMLLAGMVLVWAARLSTFLFVRTRRAGGDGRFDDIKPKPVSFLVAWSLQGLWVLVTVCAALAALTAPTDDALGWIDAAGLGVWLLGMGVEVVADRQKSAFRAERENRDDFIQTGLWAWSRHPNYFGEIVLWVGVAIVASGTLEGWRWLTWISPAFVAWLLLRVSGVPILEKRADARWGGREDYEAYKAGTPLVIPRPPR